MQPKLPTAHGSVLVIDDDELFLRVCTTVLRKAGLTVQGVQSASAALELLGKDQFDAIVSDVRMPERDGNQLLKEVRAKHPQVPFVLMSGEPTVASAMSAVEHRAFRYLQKPFDVDQFVLLVGEATQQGRALSDTPTEAQFERVLQHVWMAYQPIVDTTNKRTVAYEALLRSNSPEYGSVGEVLDLCERAKQVHALGRAVRRLVARDIAQLPPSVSVFVNLHPDELSDPDLYDPDAPLSLFSDRVVLEVTERSSVVHLAELPSYVERLRALGFRLAVDDLGAGYAGLTLLARLQPDLVKLDASLVRGIEHSPAQQLIVASVLDLAHELGTSVVAEAIETPAERGLLETLGVDLMQGYLFARPGKPFATPTF